MNKRFASPVLGPFLAWGVMLAGAMGPIVPAFAADNDYTVTGEDLFGKRYVALGSSFAAGPGLAPGKPASVGAPARCGQSMVNYPTLLAEELKLVLVDRSCAGATTEHILGPWKEIPPQIDSVTPETRLVTLTIGGNDLNYVNSAFAAVCRQKWATAPVKEGEKPATCGAFIVPGEADYATDEARLRQIVRDVRKRAPQAKVVFVQYLSLIPEPSKLCAATPISVEDALVLREIGKRLAELTERAAAAEGAFVVPMQQESAQHTPCDAKPWMNGSPPDFTGKDGIRWHLNAAGMRATAKSIAIRLNSPEWRTAPLMPVVPQPPLIPPPASPTPETAVPPETTPPKLAPTSAGSARRN